MSECRFFSPHDIFALYGATNTKLGTNVVYGKCYGIGICYFKCAHTFLIGVLGHSLNGEYYRRTMLPRPCLSMCLLKFAFNNGWQFLQFLNILLCQQSVLIALYVLPANVALAIVVVRVLCLSICLSVGHMRMS